ncbi:MAG TPA: mechanosensitive ion channel protein MscS, partial [Planctomycetes bacterium]|nr:mechanosensitive ion channel protein MscS [Planctomycetota bacterium]
GYSENPDEVIAILQKVLTQFAEDEAWKSDVLEEPQILGVDGLGESEVAFKIAVKVAPGRQWAARREMLKRIKIAFDIEGIEIPFPQRVHYVEANQPLPKTLKRRGES